MKAAIDIIHRLVARANVTQGQAGVLSGHNPAEFNPTNPITLFIIQLSLILIFTNVLALGFARIRQPKVIAEVIAGIILGPTVLGRVPGFSNSIFPTPSLSYLNLVSTIGLVLFLFLVGLEVDIGVIKRNARESTIIALAGMLLPFGLGAAIAVPIYHEFIPSSVNFGHFLLFTGTAMSITAFPVLCRILTELKLLETTVGVVVLSAGVGNDVVGWILLALTVALVNSAAGGEGTGVTAVYILLCAVGWTLLLVYPIRMAMRWLAIRTGSIEAGKPSPFMMTVTLFLVFASAFVTDIIGVHPIFGGFLAAFAVPREVALDMVIKIEDLVTVLFLPIYFTLSGLKTNLGLLDDGKTWGYVVLLCVVAFVGKFGGCAVAARLQGFNARESCAIGTLMSCKGLVELIVLNVGLSAGILTPRAFSCFVLMAIVLTVITTPLTLWCYPPRVRHIISQRRRHRTLSTASGRVDGVHDGTIEGRNRLGLHARCASSLVDISSAGVRLSTLRYSVVLMRMEQVPAVMTLLKLFQPRFAPVSRTATTDEKHVDSPEKDSGTTSAAETNEPELAAISVDALRLMELSGRMSAVMRVADSETILARDTAMQIFKTFGNLNQIAVQPAIAIVPQDSYPTSIVSHSEGTEMIILPWSVGSSSLPADDEGGAMPSVTTAAPSPNLAEVLFAADSAAHPYTKNFVRRVFAESPRDVGLFIHRGINLMEPLAHQNGVHVFVPFRGGADDRLALSLAAQACLNPRVTATVVRVLPAGAGSSSGQGGPLSTVLTSSTADPADVKLHAAALMESQQTVGRSNTAFANVQSKIASDDDDEKAWAFFTARATHDSGLGKRLILATETATATGGPLGTIIRKASEVAGAAEGRHESFMLFVGRGRSGAAAERDTVEIAAVLAANRVTPGTGAEMRRTLGDTLTAVMVAGPSVVTAYYAVQAGSNLPPAINAEDA